MLAFCSDSPGSRRQPTAFVFKGSHVDKGGSFYDYVIRFGPGSLLKFGIALYKTGRIESLSFG